MEILVGNKTVDLAKLDDSKLRALNKLGDVINHLESANVLGEFTNDLYFLKKVRNNIKTTLNSGEAKFAAEIIE